MKTWISHDGINHSKNNLPTTNLIFYEMCHRWYVFGYIISFMLCCPILCPHWIQAITCSELTPPQGTTVLDPKRIPRQEIAKEKKKKRPLAQLRSSLGHFSKTGFNRELWSLSSVGYFYFYYYNNFYLIFRVLICPTWIVIYSPPACCGILQNDTHTYTHIQRNNHYSVCRWAWLLTKVWLVMWVVFGWNCSRWWHNMTHYPWSRIINYSHYTYGPQNTHLQTHTHSGSL